MRQLGLGLLLFAAAARAANPSPDALLTAIGRDDLRAVKSLLAAKADPNAANRYGVTPLVHACGIGNAAVIQVLLTAGAQVNAVQPRQEPALLVCARTGRIEAVQTLLRAGADVNARETFTGPGSAGQTALMWAAAEGHEDVVKALTGAGASIDARLDSGYTPLLFAVREGRIPVARALIAAGASANDAIKPKPTAQRPRGGDPARAGTTALMLAVINGHYELGQVLVELGADPNAGTGPDGPGLTALHLISHTRKPGVGDNNPPPDGSGAVTSLDFVRFLARKGANLNARMTKRVPLGMTRLNTAGATPYFLAAKTADAPLLSLLQELGADPAIPNQDNSTPLMAAAGLGTRSPGEDAGTEPEVLEALRVLLAHGADVNAVDKNGETAMHAAAYKNSPGAVEYLAAHGAKPEVWDRPNKQGWTPLRIAQGYRFGNFKPSPVTAAALERVTTGPIHESLEKLR